MYFNTYQFLLLFLPVALLGYFLINRTGKDRLGSLWLLLCSAVFYVCFGWQMGLVLLGSVLVNYSAYRLLRRCQRLHKPGCLRAVRAAGVIANILLLFVFKYATSTLTLLNRMAGTDFVMQTLLLPAGISFFTFSQLSFLIDCAKDDLTDYSFLDYALYILFFPKILSGPIMRAQQLVPQFHDVSRRQFSAENFSAGLYAFTLGLSKKVLIADTLGIFVNACYSSAATCNGFEALLAIFAFALQLYFDFSGYSDMARGLGRMLNLNISINFDSPYQALDITDFWKRWHITLTSFLTRYVYYPLGGNRKGKQRQYLNILIVFLVSGLWHGVGLTFVVWGLLHGLANVLTRMLKPVLEKTPKLLRRLITFLFVTFAWVFFRADSLTGAVQMLSKPFTAAYSGIRSEIATALVQPALFNALSQLFTVDGAMLLLVVFGLVAVFFLRNTDRRIEHFRPTVLRGIVCTVLLVLSVLSLTGYTSFFYGAF